MLRINQFGLEPGTYNCDGVRVVVVDIIDRVDNGELKELEDPWVVFRDINEVSKDKHHRTMMKMSEFKSKYHKA